MGVLNALVDIVRREKKSRGASGFYISCVSRYVTFASLRVSPANDGFKILPTERQ